MAVKSRVAELESALAKAHAERDELLKDVENLCMQGDPGSVFDKSSMLVERISDANRELLKLRGRLAESEAQCDDLKADLTGVRESKLVADREARAARSRATHLERELAFYQQQSASAMADRDSAELEAEEANTRAAELDERLRASEARATAEAAAKDDAQRGLGRARDRIAELSEQVKGLEVIPGLRQDLQEAQDSCARLQDEDADLQGRLRDTTAELDSTRESLETAAADRTEMAEKLTAAGEREAQQAAECSEISEQLAHATRRADQLEEELEATQDEVEELRRQAEVQAAALAGAREALENATQQKVAALVSLSDAQAAQGRAEERLQAAQKRADALPVRLEQLQPDGSALSGQTTPPMASPQKPGWRGWLGGGRPPGASPGHGDREDASSARREGGASADVHALRGQLAAANERLAAVDAMAGRVAALRSSLATIAANANWDLPDRATLTELDKLAEEAATLRVGMVLGLGGGGGGGESDEEGDLLSALSMDAQRGRKTTASSVEQEVLDLLEVAITSVRSRAAQGIARAGSLKNAGSGAMSRAGSQLPVVKA